MRDEKNKLFVGNLSFDTTSDQLTELFGAVEGITVVEVKIVTDRETGRPRGFGFVTLENAEMAEKAMAEMNNKEIDGRMIAVKLATPLGDRNNSRGGNRGGYQGNNNFRSDRRF